MKEEHQTIGVALGGPRHETNQQQQLKSTNHVEHSRGHAVDAVELLENPGGVSRVDELVERPHQHDDENADTEKKERPADPPTASPVGCSYTQSTAREAIPVS